MPSSVSASWTGLPGVEGPAHARNHLMVDREILDFSGELREAGCWSAAGRLRPYAADARVQEVRQPCSTDEGLEQGSEASGGGTGGKAAGQAELATGHHAPDAEPGARAGGAEAGTASRRKAERSTIHRAAAPHLRKGHVAGGVLRTGT